MKKKINCKRVEKVYPFNSAGGERGKNHTMNILIVINLNKFF